MTIIGPDLARQVLDLPMPEHNDADAATVRDYLIALVRLAWTDVEMTGKRPFGDSNWRDDLRSALIKAGLIEGSLDEDGYIDDMDAEAADLLILAAIDELGKVS